ncbi:GldL-related protein [Winogradskyella sp. MIT101101]|uniref:GldL-related protein n=1 Tax=Winogradskyella sp. MIT101101 TaxID=3098297 RepID=UPI00399C2FE9
MKTSKRRLIPAIIIFLIGLAFTIIGTLFKIQHWTFASELFTIGNLFMVIGIVVAILILLRIYRTKP